jgi:hypothetical protein
MNVMEEFLSMGNFILHDGRQIRFWEGRWLSVNTLKDQYPTLYNIVRKKCNGTRYFHLKTIECFF